MHRNIELELYKIAIRDLRKLLKMRFEFPWTPGILGEYMRNKCHGDIRRNLAFIRLVREALIAKNQ